MNFRLKTLKRTQVIFLHDWLMTAVAYSLALYLRVGGHLFNEFSKGWLYGLLVVMVVSAPCYFKFGLYRGLWRYASILDLTQLAKAVMMTTLLFVLGMFVIQQIHTLPRSTPIIFGLVLLAALGGPRFIYRILKDHGLTHAMLAIGDKRIEILLIGVNDTSDNFLRSLQKQPDPLYRVVGLLDDGNGSRVGHNVRGVPVLGRFDEFESIVTHLQADGIQPQRLVLSRPRTETDGQFVRDWLDRAASHGMTLARLPRATSLEDTRHDTPNALNPIALEDLLGRPQAVLDIPAIQTMVKGKNVLITGAGGTIGSELSRQIALLGPAQLILLDHSELNLYEIDQDLRNAPALKYQALLCDIRDSHRVQSIFRTTQPDMVFHAAALKHVRLCELNPIEAILSNIIGARHVADAAKVSGVQAFVFISTDKAIRPTSVMGASKRIAEIYCQALDLLETGTTQTRFMTVRFGNVIGSSGSVVPLFQKQLARGGPLTVTHPDMKRYFMTVREAVELVLQASAHGIGAGTTNERGKIFVLDMGEPIKIIDLARQMIRLTGLNPDIDIKIEFTGMQHGEKLFEELLDENENPTLSDADRIYLATPVTLDYVQILRALENFQEFAKNGDSIKALALVGALLPDFAVHRAEAEAA